MDNNAKPMCSLFEQRALPSERIAVADGFIEVKKFAWLFRPWRGDPVGNTYGGKAVLDCDGTPAFAELALLPVLKQHGFSLAVWADTYRRCFRDAMPPAKCHLPAPMRGIYDRIVAVNGGRGGCWDVLAWDGAVLTFVECKRRHKDRMRPSGARWLNSALTAGLSLQQFVICEWNMESSRK